MKRLVAVIILTVLSLLSCESKGQTALEALPENYSLSQAKADGCVVHEDGYVTYGSEVFFDFAKETEKGTPASVRLAFYYTLDPDSVSEEYYRENKDRYPVLYVKDLFYDGEKYTLRSIEDGKEYMQEYRYMKMLPFFPPAGADYQYIRQYVLLNDNSVTSYGSIFKGLISSKMGDYIEHSTVYSELVKGS